MGGYSPDEAAIIVRRVAPEEEEEEKVEEEDEKEKEVASTQNGGDQASLSLQSACISNQRERGSERNRQDRHALKKGRVLSLLFFHNARVTSVHQPQSYNSS